MAVVFGHWSPPSMSAEAAAPEYQQPAIPGLEPHCRHVPKDLLLAGARARVIEELYQSSGRTDRSHPLHGKFTGLWEELCLQAGRALMEHALLNPQDVHVTARYGQQVSTAADGSSPEGRMPLAEAIAIRGDAHAAAAESIRLQREADRYRQIYFTGLALLHEGPGESPFGLLAA